MSSMSMGAGKQVVRPPQRGIFPLDHGAECRQPMEFYLACLKANKDMHHMCREHSRSYLQCRMDHQLMSPENLDHLGYSEAQKVTGAREYDNAKENEGFVAGKHITKESKWWWEGSNGKSWWG
jgi:cytochrome c oxidase assembly protein subunit 19